MRSLISPLHNAFGGITDIVKKNIGLDECKYFVSGAAPIDKTVLEYFSSLNMPIFEIYGMKNKKGPRLRPFFLLLV